MSEDPDAASPDQAARLMETPAEYLADAELLALALTPRMPPARALEMSSRLLRSGGSLQRVAGLSATELAQCVGIGPRTAKALRAVFALAGRVSGPDPRERPLMDSPGAVARHLRHLQGRTQEELHVLLLDTRNRLLRDVLSTVGLVDRSQAHAREVFRPAIRECCSRVVLAHNHPGGDPTPSAQDIAATGGLVAAGKIIGIEILDHVIVGTPSSACPRGYLSLREENLL